MKEKFQAAWIATKTMPRRTKRFLYRNRYSMGSVMVSLLFVLLLASVYFFVAWGVASLLALIFATQINALIVIVATIASYFLSQPLARPLAKIYGATQAAIFATAGEKMVEDFMTDPNIMDKLQQFGQQFSAQTGVPYNPAVDPSI